jgi:hypothetical protein
MKRVLDADDIFFLDADDVLSMVREVGLLGPFTITGVKNPNVTLLVLVLVVEAFVYPRSISLLRFFGLSFASNHCEL